MLKIVSGSLEKVKQELQKLIKVKREEVSELKRGLDFDKKELSKYKKKHPKKNRTEEIEQEIFSRECDLKKQEEAIKKMTAERDHVESQFKISIMLPVRVGDIVVNYKVYEQMIKKISDFHMEIALDTEKLVLRYSDKHIEGQLELYDISSTFRDVEYLPVAEIMSKEMSNSKSRK